VVASAESAAASAGSARSRRGARGEVTDLVESPSAILGSFDERFLDLPEAVLATVMIHHQRFFPTREPRWRLAPRSWRSRTTECPTTSVVRAGYEQVLRGRLDDARFFWDADRRDTLAQHAWALAGIAFHKELGSMADKVARVAKATRRLAELLGVSKEEAAVLKQALPLFRADLATQMVYELPELEGTMGCAYARAEGLPEAVAVALEDGVLPRGPSGVLAATRVGALLSIADRLDTVTASSRSGDARAARPTRSACAAPRSARSVR
jgi:glycyl-tRNA synthetase beta chain